MRLPGVVAAASVIFLWPVSPARAQSAQPSPAPPRDLTELSLSELADLEVTTVSRRPERRSRAAAAVHVITREAVLRSGVTTLADALRLAPGLQVARINNNQWAVGSRGFTSRLSRSMLVLVDGRSVYSPLFAGVYWEVQDVLLEDLDRIEVILGPGGTVWGANAVNGVINIVTRSARDSAGLFVQAGAGSEQSGFGGVRYGGALGTRGAWRVYGKYMDRDPGFHAQGPEFDTWSMGQGGFRADWTTARGDGLTVQGDLYDGRAGESLTVTSYTPPYVMPFQRKSDLSGGNLLGRWQRSSAQGASFSVQSYYDRTRRDQVNFREVRNTFDVEAQARRTLAARHDVVAGVGYRASHGAGSGPETISFVPPTRTDQLANAFVLDEIALHGQEVSLSLGVKLEHNSYSGFEAQPAARLLWSPASGRSVWAAVSRAVRTPSRLEHDLALTAILDPRGPVFARIRGDAGFDSEKALVYEAGGRTTVGPRLALDAALFYNRYRDLTSLEPGAPFTEGTPRRTVVPYVFGNGIEGRNYGGELSADVQAWAGGRFSAAYSYLRLDLHRKPGSRDISQEASIEGTSPRHQLFLRASLDLPRRLTLDAVVRRASALPMPRIEAYTSLDARLAWRAPARLELAVVGQNLLAAHHLEFGGPSPARTEVQRGVYAEALARW